MAGLREMLLQEQDRLEKIGASDRDYVSQDDWKSLLEIARQPKGIRLP